MRLLIADDNSRMRRFLLSLVQDLVSESEEACDGLDAVQRYARRRADAVLMDIRMPRLDGIESTRRILAIDPAATVIIVSEFDTSEYRVQAASAGARGYVAKDCLGELHGTLQKMIYTDGRIR
jgi:CheY-like chemotaxis protein